MEIVSTPQSKITGRKFKLRPDQIPSSGNKNDTSKE